MSNKKRLSGAVSFMLLPVLIWLSLAACTGSASSVSGTCTVAQESEIENKQMWNSADGLLHYRGGLLQLGCKVNDDRLKGDWFNAVNFDADQTTFSGAYYGGFYILGADGSSAWDGSSHGYVNSAGNFTGEATLYGRGEYEGLKLELEMNRPKDAKEYTLKGSIVSLEK